MNPKNSPDPLTLQLALNQLQEYYLELKTMMQNLEQKLHGDTIQEGGTKNINYYYYDHNNHMVAENDQPYNNKIAKLDDENARILMLNLVDAGMLDDDWQPVKLSGPQRALLAKAVSDRLNITDVWQLFGQLWNENPSTLRSYLSRAFDQKKSLQFQDKLKNALN